MDNSIRNKEIASKIGLIGEKYNEIVEKARNIAKDKYNTTDKNMIMAIARLVFIYENLYIINNLDDLRSRIKAEALRKLSILSGIPKYTRKKIIDIYNRADNEVASKSGRLVEELKENLKVPFGNSFKSLNKIVVYKSSDGYESKKAYNMFHTFIMLLNTLISINEKSRVPLIIDDTLNSDFENNDDIDEQGLSVLKTLKSFKFYNAINVFILGYGEVNFYLDDERFVIERLNTDNFSLDRIADFIVKGKSNDEILETVKSNKLAYRLVYLAGNFTPEMIDDKNKIRLIDFEIVESEICLGTTLEELIDMEVDKEKSSIKIETIDRENETYKLSFDV